MMKYKVKLFALFALLAAGMFGCEMEQEVDLPEHEPKLTLRLALANVDTLAEHSIQYKYSALFIGRSQSVLYPDESLTGMANATVKLYDESGNVVEEYAHTGYTQSEYGYKVEMQGYYASTKNFVPEPGKTYTIRASAHTFQDIEATTMLPEKPVVTDLSFDGQPSPADSYTIEGDLKLTIADEPGKKNYYRLVAVPLDSTYARIADSPARSIDAYDGADFGNNEKPRLGDLFSDELYSSGKITLLTRIAFPGIDYASFQTGKKRYARYLEVQVQQLTESEYLFAKTLEAQWRSDDNPFAESQNVYSNVNSGYGVLGGVTVTRVVVEAL
ncbi:DUF4249 domain-containing protein [Pontibacter sp. 172403-2]|uniref:DUF4249 domain-containing protein n=1 Tax=Pontibacter rufus TaxID=2791028 RepID=UPI0018AFBCB7|nr:DUF4249 domain-containing protein [Pontibacter sp. 172403-2]MBF9252016.1 DUF4249 domain-containing protein [Pontibacter sp. 172403-2]